MPDLTQAIHAAITRADRWSRRLFAGDDADGATFGRMTVHRAPDGTLYGVINEPKKPKEKS